MPQQKFDDKLPVTFMLPDGDQVALVTWAYIVDKVTTQLTPIVNALGKTNEHLAKIDEKLDEWTEQN